MKYNCDCCKKEINVGPKRFSNQKTVCCSRKCANKLKGSYYIGENNPNYGNRGESNALFNGKTIITGQGYVQVYSPKHPLSNKSGRLLEHRLLAEKYLAKEEQLVVIDGYKVLNPKLDVHHKDYNKANNALDNLEILTKKDHMTLHQRVKHMSSRVEKLCLHCGTKYTVIKSRAISSKYCSRECTNAHRGRNTVNVTCPVCKRNFLTSRNQPHTCCSVICSNKLRDRGLIEFTCDYCGIVSKMKRSRFNKSIKHFCNKDCYYNSKKI